MVVEEVVGGIEEVVEVVVGTGEGVVVLEGEVHHCVVVVSTA